MLFIPDSSVVLARAELLQVPSSASTVTLKTSPQWICVRSQEVAEVRQEEGGMLWFCVCARTMYVLAPAAACHDTFTVRESHLSTAVTLAGSQGAEKRSEVSAESSERPAETSCTLLSTVWSISKAASHVSLSEKTVPQNDEFRGKYSLYNS